LEKTKKQLDNCSADLRSLYGAYNALEAAAERKLTKMRALNETSLLNAKAMKSYCEHLEWKLEYQQTKE